jgi:YebC/PmpR family DNA-binding regulatory protein
MAGHSKWANIKHRKDKADKQKGKAFSRVAKEIISAVKLGGPDPKANPRLRLAIQKARIVNMPSENVDRNIKKATSADQANYEEISYEIYGHGGVGIIVETMTDNKNRTASDMRIATNKRGGTIANPGAVAFNFDRKGLIQVSKEGVDEDSLFLAVTEAGADEFDVEEECFVVVTPSDLLFQVKEKIDASGANCLEAELSMVPKLLVEVDEEAREANQRLIDWLEDLDDVDCVYHNMAEE